MRLETEKKNYLSYKQNVLLYQDLKKKNIGAIITYDFLIIEQRIENLKNREKDRNKQSY